MTLEAGPPLVLHSLTASANHARSWRPKLVSDHPVVRCDRAQAPTAPGLAAARCNQKRGGRRGGARDHGTPLRTGA